MTRWALQSSVRRTRRSDRYPTFLVRVNPLLERDVVPPGFSTLDSVLEELVDAGVNDRLRDQRRQLATKLDENQRGLKWLRLKAGLSQVELAKLIGTSQPRLSMWEKDPTSISAESIRALVSALGIDYNDFYEVVFGG